MTREEAIKGLRGILTEAVEFENSVCYVTDEDREPLEMAIKALEQEDAIEKIRAEVKSINLWALRYAPTYDEDIRPQIVSNVKEHVLEIIDKYREDT